jgi:RsiW-degrading membrane proteinase PrsW (M82 family)
MFSSVALCEEVLKFIPVMYVAKSTAGDWKQRGLFVGALSGLGFGLVEGVMYHFQMYQPQDMPLSIYLLRFFSVAMLHGCWTIISAACFYHLLENPEDNSHKPPTDIFEYTFLILFSVIASMALHSLYNVLVTGSLFLGLLVAWLTVFVTVRVFEALPEPQNLPCTDSAGEE